MKCRYNEPSGPGVLPSLSSIQSITAKDNKADIRQMINAARYLNPLSPNIHIQILQTDLSQLIVKGDVGNLIKDHFLYGDHLLILITLSLDNVWILLGENCCWSLLALKGLSAIKENIRRVYSQGSTPQYSIYELII